MNHYPHLNSPIRIRNTVFQNRLLCGPGLPIFAQASEPYPSDTWISYFIGIARSGVGGVTTVGGVTEVHITEADNKGPDIGHFPRININDPLNQHRFAEMAEAIKANGAVAICQCMASPGLTAGYDVSSDVLSEYVEGDGSVPVMGEEAPKDMLYRVIETFASNARLMQTLGYQMAQIHMAYRNMFAGRFLSRFTNRRTDEFGGSLENRARFPIMVCEAIKKACGDDFIVHIAITAEEPKGIYGDEGLTMEETCEFLELIDGKADVVSIREHQIDIAQGPGFRDMVLPNRDSHKVLSKFIRSNGLKVKLAYVCGAHDLDDCEDLVASGDCDFVLSSRAYITNPDFAVKMREGRNDDVTPCLRCSRCHHDTNDSWQSVCAVNPLFSFEVREPFMIRPYDPPKTVAVIGGGCAGLKFAMDACDLGHAVTLYEKESELGGQLNLAGIPYVKTFVKKFRDYLVHQVEKRNIRIALGTEVKPGELSGKYDRTVIAIGAEPIIPKIPGIDIGVPFDHALTHPDAIKGDVVVIGGGEVGLECALHFTHLGHKAKIIEMQDVLAPEMAPCHFRRPYREMWEAIPEFTYELNATVTEMRRDGNRCTVMYRDALGSEVPVPCDTVVIAAGTKGLYDQAIALSASENTRLIGDCLHRGSVPSAMRNAYFIARNL